MNLENRRVDLAYFLQRLVIERSQLLNCLLTGTLIPGDFFLGVFDHAAFYHLLPFFIEADLSDGYATEYGFSCIFFHDSYCLQVRLEKCFQFFSGGVLVGSFYRNRNLGSLFHAHTHDRHKLRGVHRFAVRLQRHLRAGRLCFLNQNPRRSRMNANLIGNHILK